MDEKPPLPDKLKDIPSWLRSMRNEKHEISPSDSIQLGSKLNDYIKEVKKKQNAFSEEKSDLNTVITKLEKKISSQAEQLAEKVEEINLIKEHLNKIFRELGHSNLDIKIAERLLAENSQMLSTEQIENCSTRFVNHSTTPPNLSLVGDVSLFGNFWKPTQPSEMNLERYTTGLFDVFTGWNRPYVSADSVRGMIYPTGINASLCDGTSQGGEASGVVARIFSTFFSSGFPLTQGFVNLFCRGRTSLSDLLIFPFLRYRHEEMTFPTRILRTTPLELKHQILNDIHKSEYAATTAVNVILTNNGAVWARSVGDSVLYLYRSSENSFYQRLPMTASTGHGTEAIGIDSDCKLTKPIYLYMEPGDGLVLASDLLSETDLSQWQNKITEMHHLPQNSFNPTKELWSDIVKSTTQADDISMMSIVFHGDPFCPTEVDVSGDEKSELVVDGRSYRNDVDGRYLEPIEKHHINLFSVLPEGVKIIPKIVAASLDSFKNYHTGTWPDFIPNFEVLTGGGMHFLKMSHFTEDYQRLDDAIKNADGRDAFGEIRRSLQELLTKMEDSMISHCDIAPSNIFQCKKSGKLFLIDLNSLFWPGAMPPPEIEKGHSGMYGSKKELTNVPSLINHRLPFRVLDLTLYLLETTGQSFKDAVEPFGVDEGSNGQYILTPEQVWECFDDEEENRSIAQKLKTRFQSADADLVNELTFSLYRTRIFGD